MTKLVKDSELRDPDFRPLTCFDKLAGISYDDKMYKYTLVQYNKPNEYQRHVDLGWETVVSEDNLIDQRDPSGNKENYRPVPATKRLKDPTGIDCVLMRMSNEKFQEMLAKDKKERHKIFETKRTVQKSTGIVKIQDSEISSDDINK